MKRVSVVMICSLILLGCIGPNVSDDSDKCARALFGFTDGILDSDNASAIAPLMEALDECFTAEERRSMSQTLLDDDVVVAYKRFLRDPTNDNRMEVQGIIHSKGVSEVFAKLASPAFQAALERRNRQLFARNDERFNNKMNELIGADSEL